VHLYAETSDGGKRFLREIPGEEAARMVASREATLPRRRANRYRIIFAVRRDNTIRSTYTSDVRRK
jgi:hypothetical protein